MSEVENPVQEKKSNASRLGWGLIWGMIAIYVIDQVTKMLVVFNFDPPELMKYTVSPEGVLTMLPPESVSVIDGVFNIVRVHNSGVAFGLGNGSAWSTYVFLAVPIIAIIALIIMLKKGLFNTALLKTGWALLFTGVCGNLTDRLVQGFIQQAEQKREFDFLEGIQWGKVVDFIDVHIPVINYHWPAFNVADSCICIAAAIFFISCFIGGGNSAKGKANI